MTIQENVASFVDTRGKKGRTAEVGVQALHQAAMRLADVRRAGTRFKTKDLVGLLLSHGARAWRSSLPPVRVTVRAFTPTGEPAVKIGFKQL